jgi:hypothetical protein
LLNHPITVRPLRDPGGVEPKSRTKEDPMRPYPAMRRLTPVALLVVLAACADTGGSAAERAIDDREEWCATVREVDERFKTADNSDGSFEVKQARYERIGELVGELDDGIAVVDATDRDAVRSSLEWTIRLTDALVAADDGRDAERLVEPLYAPGEQIQNAAAPWIRKNCGVDIAR